METATNALKSVLPVSLGGEPTPAPTVPETSTASDPAERTDIKASEDKSVDNLTKDAQFGSFAASGTGVESEGKEDITASGPVPDQSTGTGIAEKISSSLPASVAPISTIGGAHHHDESHKHSHKHHHKHHEHQHIIAPSFVSKTGGVGSLPGTPNEAGVAILPDEKTEKQRAIGKVEQIGELGPISDGFEGGTGETKKEEVESGSKVRTKPQAQPTAPTQKTPGDYDPTSVSGEGPHGLVWDKEKGTFLHGRDLEGAGTSL